MTKNTPHIISLAGLNLIRISEALRLNAYLCPANRVTIGYGHVLLPKWDCGLFANLDSTGLARIITQCRTRRVMSQEAKSTLHINRAQADKLLEKDANQTALFLNSVVRVELNQNQFDALSSLIFNIGQGNFAASTLRKKLNAGDFDGTAAEFDRWVYGAVDGKKQILPGSVTRRAAERALFSKVS